MSEGKAALKEERCKDAEKLFNDVLMDNKNYKLIIKTLKNDTAKQISKEEAAKELEDLKIYTNKRGNKKIYRGLNKYSKRVRH